jgi:NAD(P)-dependent dehydrogenase (short-subunit alcohol dehydrogenase family)
MTTRFPNDAALRYAREPDFAKWKDRLSLFGLDLRHAKAVETFIDTLVHDQSALDIIINNAAQTIRRPPLYYRHLLDNELSESKAAGLRELFDGRVSDIHGVQGQLLLAGPSLLHYANAGVGRTAAELSQVPLIPGDDLIESECFPPNRLDKDGQQEDRRDTNSWSLELDQVNLIELYEVLAVNLVSPFLFNSRLKPLLSRRNRSTFIVNVTAMEGNFNAPDKSTRHPHTNMAKAGLNMMTRTAADYYYANAGIMMNSVDTGLITNERPYPLSVSEHDRRHVMAIDEVDGAARILDPIVTTVSGGDAAWGRLYKNYREYPW